MASNTSESVHQNAPSSADPGLPLKVVDRQHDQQTNQPSKAPWRRRLLKLRWLPVIMLLVVSGGFIGIYYQPTALRLFLQTTNLKPGGGTLDPIAVPAPQANPNIAIPEATYISALGTLLPASELITVAAPSGGSDAKLAELRVDEGDQVKAGEIIAVLDNEPILLAQMQAAKLKLEHARASLVQAQVDARANLQELNAAVAQAKSTAKNRNTEFLRAQELFKQAYLTPDEMDLKRSQKIQADRQVDILQARLSRYDLDDINQVASVQVAARNVDTIAADLAWAERKLESAYVRAPVTATVLKVHRRIGERSGIGGVVDIGNVQRMIARLEVYQSEIHRLRIGAEVQIQSEALTRMLHGQITKIGYQVKRQALIGTDPAAYTDARVIDVTVSLDKASSVAAAHLTNLQVIAYIDNLQAK